MLHLKQWIQYIQRIHLKLDDEMHKHSQPCLIQPSFHLSLQELLHRVVQILHMLLPIQVGIGDQVD